MGLNFFQTLSLKTKVTLSTMIIFLVSIWVIAFYANRMLIVSMQRQLGDQQFSTVSIVASQVNQELENRLKALNDIAGDITPAMMADTPALQAYLEQSAILPLFFNGGAFVTLPDGTATASIPISAGRGGLNFIGQENIATALKEGKTAFGKPNIGKALKVPVLGIATPIHNAQGKVIGALVAVIDLSKPNFLDRITENRYGKSGGYLLIAPKYRLIVTATDRSRIMTPSFPPGANSLVDKFMQGYEGSGVFVNSVGEEVLDSAKRVPIADLLLTASLPSAEAFAPIHDMQQRLLISVIFVTVLAGTTIWLMIRGMLKRQLSPMLAASRELTIISDANLAPQPLQIATRQDEIGELIGGFNRMLETLKNRERLLRESEYFFKESQRAASIGSYHVDFVTGIWKSSEVLDTIWGIDRDYVRSIQGWLDIIHPDDRQMMDQYLKEEVLSQKKPFSHEYRIVRQNDGGTRWVYGLGVVSFDEYDNIQSMIGTIQDITDRKKSEEDRYALEQKFQQTQRLESLGVLTGGIAHDFNNILTVIVGNCSLAKMNPGNEKSYLPNIEMAAARATELCRQMLAYAGKTQTTKTEVNLSILVDEIVSMLKTTLPHNTVIKPHLSADLPCINADASQIRQVVMNLIINASEAIGKVQGEVNISLAKTTIIAGSPVNDYHGRSIPSGAYVCLEITDNGCGMDEQTKLRIFEPFFTTKFTGRGLGMSAVIGIISSHGGALQLFSHLGQGTTFKVYLPVPTSDPAGAGRLGLPTPSAPWQGSGIILLVEDEDQVRLIAKTLLLKFGFTVLEAVNGKEALELYQKNADDIRLVLTDMGMPVMDGYELFYELKNRNSKLPIIVSSGFADTEVTSRIGSDNIAGFINKPYNPEQLLEVLKGVVEDTPVVKPRS